MDEARGVRLDRGGQQAEGFRAPKQAVMVIHGIGDQAPMRTLRAFTHGIGLRRLFSSPDRISGSDDLRRLTEVPTAALRAHTDFFEFYWAHHAPDGGGLATLTWALRLLLRREWRRRHGHVAAVVLGIQAVVVLAVVAGVLAGAWTLWRAWRGGGVGDHLGGAGPWLAMVILALVLIHLAVSGFLRRVLSDAVRYLHPRPDNIEARRRIREEGLHLLRRLHSSGEYDRVVVVGHSLGAVIGYDLLRSLWDEARHPDPRIAGDQRDLPDFDAAADLIDPEPRPVRIPPATAPPATDDLERFQQAQFDLWRADRRDGVPWLVTDFVTVGSPLTYASLLFADPPLPLQGWPGLSLAQKQELREYPRCPPIPDEVEPGRFYTRDYLLGDPGLVSGDQAASVRSLRVGHSAAVFGPTRWTNLYLPSRGVVFGDLLAGPAAPEFGPGVRDVPVRLTSRGAGRWRSVFPASHLAYWWTPADATRVETERTDGAQADAPFAETVPGAPSPDPVDRDLPAAADGPCESAIALAAALRLADITRVPIRADRGEETRRIR